MSVTAQNVTELVSDYLSKQSVPTSGVAVQAGVMSALSLAGLATFAYLRPRNSVVYAPKAKYAKGSEAPPSVSNGFWAWMNPIRETDELLMLDKSGLDGVTFLRVLRLLKWSFASLTVLTFALTLPIDIAFNATHKQQSADGRSTVLMYLNAANVNNKLIIAHIICLYLATAIYFFFIYKNYERMVELRQIWFRSRAVQDQFYQRTLIVTNLPSKIRDDNALQAMVTNLRIPYTLQAVHIGRHIGELPELVHKHKEAVHKVEKLLCRYLKGGQIGNKRPTEHGQDAIQKYTQRIKALEDEINYKRANFGMRKPEPYGFVSFQAVPHAHVVARILINKRPEGAKLSLAPNPKDIIWRNLNESKAVRARRKSIGWLVLLVLCFFNTLPLLAISILSNLSALASSAISIPFLVSWSHSKAWGWTFTIISGVLPSLISLLFGIMLPAAMRRLAKYQGATSKIELDQIIIKRYFGFIFFNNILLFSLFSVIFNNIIVPATKKFSDISGDTSTQKVLTALKQGAQSIPKTYISLSAYWLTYIPLRGFIIFYDLSRVLSLIWSVTAKRVLNETPRETRERTAPGKFEFSLYYGDLLLLATVGSAYTVLAPLVPLGCTFVFFFASWFYKYQLLYVFTTKSESGGAAWPLVVNRLLVGVILAQLLMVLTIGLTELGWIMCSAVGPTVLMTIAFKLYLRHKFDQDFYFYMPTPEELTQVRLHTANSKASSKLAQRYGQPALTAPLETVMVFDNMLPLVGRVYSGKVDDGEVHVAEISRRFTTRAKVVDNVAIAGVQEDDILDPANMGEYPEWDAGQGSEGLESGRATPAGSFSSKAYDAMQDYPYAQNYHRYEEQDSRPLLDQNDRPGFSRSGSQGSFAPEQQYVQYGNNGTPPRSQTPQARYEQQFVQYAPQPPAYDPYTQQNNPYPTSNPYQQAYQPNAYQQAYQASQVQNPYQRRANDLPWPRQQQQ